MKCATLVLLLFATAHSGRIYNRFKQWSMEDITTGNNQFGNELYESLSDKHPADQNLVFSPFSAHQCLSLLYQGARGDTEQVLTDHLHVINPSYAAEGYKELLARIDQANEVELVVANKVYISNQKHIKDGFKATAVDEFKSEVESLDFSQAPAAIATINSWVGEKTKSKITELLKEGDVTPNTDVILLNAVYFKGQWLFPFSVESTHSERFTTDGETFIDVVGMHLNGKHLYYKEDDALDAQVIELPYSQNEYSMVVLLPRSTTGIPDLERKLVAANLTSLLEGVSLKKVDLTLPQFEFETTMNLKEHLIGIGMNKIFEPEADLSGLVEEGNLHVSDVIQKAYVKVNENGTEAAAATAIFMVGAAPGPDEVVTFKADHPFIFLIVRKDTSVPPKINVLFYGKVVEPVKVTL